MKVALVAVLAAALPVTPPIRPIIKRHLGRPYVWGAAGLKSFDCSGFVWRVMNDSGMYVKRTTARKMYFSMAQAPREQRWGLGNLVFFDAMKHVGIVNDAGSFYHAESRVGTNLSNLGPYWRGKVCGVRSVPWPSEP